LVSRDYQVYALGSHSNVELQSREIMQRDQSGRGGFRHRNPMPAEMPPIFIFLAIYVRLSRDCNQSRRTVNLRRPLLDWL